MISYNPPPKKNKKSHLVWYRECMEAIEMGESHFGGQRDSSMAELMFCTLKF